MPPMRKARKPFLSSLTTALKALPRIWLSLRHPRAPSEVYRDYNLLRQSYILQATSRHFETRDDDPAPLYGKNLLDVGCGESTIAQFLALSGAEITAIDPDPLMLNRAKKAAAAFGAPINFLPLKAEKLINAQQKFDVILALDLMEEETDPAKLIWVLGKLLAPGGIIIFSSINRTFRAWLIHIFLSSIIYRRTRRGSRSFWRFYTPRQLARMARDAGLRLKHIQGLRFSFSKQHWKMTDHPHTRYMATATAL